ncbi:MAG TPA: diversity-generating retroelement protein Avd [Roseiflexaceae bacterium]|nr:diversity-generating retroelement protein Avd [Roseiflexaceae bacterium]
MPDSPIFARCDTLVLWVLRATVRYPRHYRAALGKATQEAALRLQRELVAAARRRERRSALQAADEALHELRLLLRQGAALELLTPAQHEHAARLVDEVGRLLGGWRKVQARAATGEPPADETAP